MSESYIKNKELQGKLEVAARDIEESRESFNRRLLPSGDIGRKFRKLKEIEEKIDKLFEKFAELEKKFQELTDPAASNDSSTKSNSKKK